MASDGMGRVIFHCGFPKCGSSSLQVHLFGVHPSIDYLSPNVESDATTPFQADPRTRDFILALVSVAKEARETIHHLWQSHFIPAIHLDRTALVSKEELLTTDVAPEEMMSRIASVCPAGHILLIIREQKDLLRSYYDMYPTIPPGTGAYASFERWLDWAFNGGLLLVDRLNYSRSIAAALTRFGAANTHVFDFNKIFVSKEEVDRLARCLSLPAHDVAKALDQPAVNDFSQHSVRKLTRRLMGPLRASWFLPYPVINRLNRAIARVVPAQRTHVSAEQVERIRNHYAKDNALMHDLCPGKIGF